MSLPSNIRLVRKRWRESLEVFSDRFGLSRFAVGKYESGENEPSASFLAMLERLTGLSGVRLVDEVLRSEDVPAAPLDGPVPVVGVMDSEERAKYVASEAGGATEMGKVLELVIELQRSIDNQGERITSLENRLLKVERPF